jgi:hypothetical protein
MFYLVPHLLVDSWLTDIIGTSSEYWAGAVVERLSERGGLGEYCGKHI